MNAILLLSAAWMNGAEPAQAAAAPVPAPVAVSGSGCCQSNSCCGESNNCCKKPSLIDRIRARFARNNNCCDSAPKCCDSAPKCSCERSRRCKPACGTPLFSGRSKCGRTCNSGCNNSCDSCGRASFLDRLRARFASKKNKGDCCGSSSDCCGGVAAPATPGTPTTPAPEAPKVMPKKTSSMFSPSILTPAASTTIPSIPQPAPAPAPVLGGKSPF